MAALTEQIDRLRARGDWPQLACLELLLVRGWSNQQVAATLGQSQQTVANTKFGFLERVRLLVRRQEPDPGRLSRVVPMTNSSLTDAELLAYLDEALPADTMADVERWLRGDTAGLARVASLSARRDAGVHSLSEIWRRHHLSCPSRQEWGSYLLGGLPPAQCRILSDSPENGRLPPLSGQSRRPGAPASPRRRRRRNSAEKVLRIECRTASAGLLKVAGPSPVVPGGVGPASTCCHPGRGKDIVKSHLGQVGTGIADLALVAEQQPDGSEVG